MKRQWVISAECSITSLVRYVNFNVDAGGWIFVEDKRDAKIFNKMIDAANVIDSFDPKNNKYYKYDIVRV